VRKYRVSPPIGRGSKVISVGRSEKDQGLFLGRLSEVGPGKNVCLDTSREHVVAIVGKRGSGKTHTLGVILEGLGISEPSSILSDNSGDRAVIVFDTLNLFQWVGVPLESAGGETAREQLNKAKSWGLPVASLDAKLWHLAGLNPVAKDSMPLSIRVAEMGPQDWGLLMDVDITTEPMGQLVALTYDKVTRSGWGTKLERRSAIQNYSIKNLIDCINQDAELSREFTPDTRRAVRQRLSSYEAIGLFSSSGTPLQQLAEPGKVSILLLGRVSEDLRTLVAFLIMRRLLELRFAASEAIKDSVIRGTTTSYVNVPKTWVFIDEAQNIMPAKTASIANKELTRFVREGRNFGLSMAISTQQPQAIDAKVMSQVDILIVHTLTSQSDINYVLNNLKSAAPDMIGTERRTIGLAEAIRELEVGQCLISAVESHRVIFTEVRPRVTPHGGFEA